MAASTTTSSRCASSPQLEQRYPGFPGLNLTWELREGIVKHETAVRHLRCRRLRPREARPPRGADRQRRRRTGLHGARPGRRPALRTRAARRASRASSCGSSSDLSGWTGGSLDDHDPPPHDPRPDRSRGHAISSAPPTRHLTASGVESVDALQRLRSQRRRLLVRPCPGRIGR